MKRTYIFVILAVLCAIGLSAKTIYIWHNGIKTDLPIQTNDSITFNEGSSPTMHIWRNGSDIYQLTLAVNDSITYSQESSVPPTAVCFDYDHWRDVDTINIYEFHDHVWQTIALPWAGEASTTIPDYYRFPNLEFHIDTLNHDTVPIWQLAFNTCHNPTLDGVHMFGLWNEKSNIMRIYSYLEELPNSNAAYCFYRAESSSPVFIDRDAITWMPSNAMLQNGNWNTAALSGVASVPSTTICDLMPFATMKTDGSEAFAPVFAGWLAFDLSLNTSMFSVPKGGSIKFYLEAVQSIDATGTVDFNTTLGGTGTGTSTGTGTTETTSGGITIPGNKNKKTAGWFTSFGSAISGIGSAITSGISAGGGEGLFGGIVQGIGSCFSIAGNLKNADEEATDKRYGLDFATKDSLHTSYDLNFDLNGSITGQFDAQLTSTLSSSAKPIAISYDKFFEGILAHPKPNQAPKIRKNDGNSNGNNLSLGIWNLKNQPVLYVCEDAKFDGNTLISFLDPSSIELMLNKDNSLFDYDEIDSIQVVAYDFAFVDSSYNFSSLPYYDFYGISRDTTFSFTYPSYDIYGILREDTILINGGLEDSDFLLNDTAEYQTFTKDGISYTGVSSTALVDAGLGMYNMVFSPKISTSLSTPELNTLGVAVVLEITFKNGEKRIFAERFLPQIKVFSLDKIKDICTHIQDVEAPSIEGIDIEYMLFDKQKAKALRLLYAARFPIVTDQYRRGIRIKYGALNDFTIYLGKNYGGGARPSITTLVNLHNHLLHENVNFDFLNNHLERNGLPSLNNYIIGAEYPEDYNPIVFHGTIPEHGYNVETGEEAETGEVDLYIYDEFFDVPIFYDVLFFD